MNSFILANAQQCLGCRACEVACVMAHNHERHALTDGQFLPRIRVVRENGRANAVTCRHCESAPCANICPNGAISRLDNSIRVNQHKCIGCKSCVLACPFGAMEVAATPVNKSGGVKANAHKCDLCYGRDNGPACVENCPGNALKFISASVLNDLTKSRRLRAAAQETQPAHTTAQQYSKQQPLPSDLSAVMKMRATPLRHEPEKIDIELRKTGFAEIYRTFTKIQAHHQADRCLKCGEHSICEWTCPLHNHIPQWIELVKEGRIMEAVELAHQTNCLPEVTGRVCPQDRLCENRCTLKDEYGAVTIGNIERFISDSAFASGWTPDLSYVKQRSERVAIIGAGPAGLACADVLVRNGVQTTVFDLHPEIGGLLTFGIPAFKLDKSLLSRRREIFSAMGVKFKLNCEIGRDIQLSKLLTEYHAVFIGVGTYRSMKAGLPNEDAPGVYDALPFLIANTKQVMGLPELPEQPYISMTEKRVVVLGGGDTAMDCVRTSIRHGAHQVTCAYRRDEANMPGSHKEVKNAREEGALFEFNVQPLNIELDAQGVVIGIRMLRTRMGEPDSQGRRRPEPIAGSEFVMPADAVVMAFGFHPHGMPWLEEQGVKLDSWGRIVASVEDELHYQTSNPKIFAGGDAVRGADLVVTAMAEGRHAAAGLLAYLNVSLPHPPNGFRQLKERG